jgi:hypothetical protein
MPSGQRPELRPLNYVASRTLHEPLPWPNSSLPEGADADTELKDDLPHSMRGPRAHQLREEA